MRVWASAALVVVTLSCKSSAGPEESRREVATVSGLRGSAEVLRGGGSDWRPLSKNARLYDEDRIRTFKGAQAMLAFQGGSSLRIDEESLISLGAIAAGGGVVVERGSVEGELQPGLQVKTPALEAESAPVRDIEVR
jgi:hypothetical protein